MRSLGFRVYDIQGLGFRGLGLRVQSYLVCCYEISQ